MYLDVVSTLVQAVATGKRGFLPRLVGGRYGLSSKDFSPALAKAAFDELGKKVPRTGFTLGIDDDVSHTSLAADPAFPVDPPGLVCAVFYGLGADGTVGANKNTVKIIAEDAGLHAQGYFVYDFAQIRRPNDFASALRGGADPSAVSDPAGELCGDPSVFVRGAPRRVATGGAERHCAAERPIRSRADLGQTAGRDADADHPRSSCGCSSSMRPRWPRTSACVAAPIPSCKPASSPCPVSCRATEPSPRSRSRSRRPTASAARRWSIATSRLWTTRWPDCSR